MMKKSSVENRRGHRLLFTETRRILSLLLALTLACSMLPIPVYATGKNNDRMKSDSSNQPAVAEQSETESVSPALEENLNAPQAEAAVQSDAREAAVAFTESHYTCAVGDVIRVSLTDNSFLSCTWSCSDSNGLVFLEERSTRISSRQIRGLKAGTYTITAKICTFTDDYSVSATVTVTPIPDIKLPNYSFRVGDSGAISFEYSYTKPIESVTWKVTDGSAVKFTGETSILSSVTPDTPEGMYEYVVSIPITCVKEGTFVVTGMVDMGDQQITVNISLTVTRKLYTGNLEKIGDLLTDSTQYVTINGWQYKLSNDCNIYEINQAYYSERCTVVVYTFNSDNEIEEIYPADIIFKPTIALSTKTDCFVYQNGAWKPSSMVVSAYLSLSCLSTSPFSEASLRQSSLSVAISKVSLSVDSDALNFGTTGGLLSKEITTIYENNVKIYFGSSQKIDFTLNIADQYVPEEITEYASVSTSVRPVWGDETVSCNPVTVSLGNLDLQAERAAAAKQERKESTALKEVHSELEEIKDKSIISDSIELRKWFGDEEYENIMDFLLLHMTLLLAAEEESLWTELSDHVQEELCDLAREMLGVEYDSNRPSFGIVIDSVRSTVQYQAKTTAGDLATITFETKLLYGANSQGQAHDAYEEIKFTISGNMPDGATSNTGWMTITYVDFEAFADVVIDYVNLAYHEMWGKDFEKLLEAAIPDIFDDILGGDYTNKIYRSYTNWVKDYTKKYTFHCPVDVYVYDREGNVVASIVDNQVNQNYTGILAAASGDTKILYLTGDSYRLKLVGSDAGEMDCVIEEYENGTLERTVKLLDVPLTDGKIYNTLAFEYPEIPQELYALKADSGEEIQIYSDSKEITYPTTPTITLKYQGSCGENAQYRIFSNGLLWITGTGPISDVEWIGMYEHKFPPYSYSNVKYVVVDEGITRIGDYAFSGSGYANTANWNDNIVEVVVADSVTQIGVNAFYGASNLQYVHLGSGVKSISEEAFNYCYNLAGIFVDAENQSFTSSDGILFAKDKSTIWCYPRYSAESYTIPEYVTSVSSDAFANNHSLKSITFSGPLIYLGERAFYDCENLETVIQSGDVFGYSDSDYLGLNTFAGCQNLTTLVLTETCTDLELIELPNLVSIQISERNPVYASDAQGAVYDKEYRTLIRCPRGYAGEFIVPDTVTNIAISAFAECRKLTAVSMSDSVTDVEASAFYKCTNLERILFSTNIEHIGNSAFSECTALASHASLENLVTLGDKAFYQCTALPSVEFGENLVSIGEDSFFKCDSLANVSFSDSGRLVSIGEDAFASCDALTSIELPDGVESIGSGALAYCGNLTSVRIPNTIDKLGRWFYGSPSLSHINVPADNAYLSSVDGVVYNKYQTKLLYCPIGRTGDLVIPYGVQTIESHAFEDCAGLTGIEMPYGIQKIGSHAFEGCTGLSNVTFPESLYVIDDYAFNDCTALTNVTLPSTLTTIGDGAFSDCSSLTSLQIPRSVTEIGFNAFSGCIGLTEVIFCGNPPAKISSSPFFGIAANAYYHSGDDTWTADIMQTIGSTLTWGAMDLCTEGYHCFDSIITAPTCVAAGYTTYTCCYCDYSYADHYVEDGTHFYDEWHTVEHEFGSSTGLSRRDCLYCDHYETGAFVTAAAGSFGNGMYWVLTDQGVLKVMGRGDMPSSFGNTALIPWVKYRRDITALEIDDAITSIGEDAFLGCDNLQHVTIGHNIDSIGSFAFYSCDQLTQIWFQGNVPEIHYRSFEDVEAVCYYPENNSTWTDDVMQDYSGSITWIPLGEIVSVEVTALPLTEYAVGDLLDLSDLRATITDTNGNRIELTSADLTISKCDMSSAGVKSITVSYGDFSANFQVYVHTARVDHVLDVADYPESTHKYANNLDETQTIHYSGASGLTLVFSEETYTENGYDYIYVYDGVGSQIASYTGDAAAGVNLNVPGDTAKIRLVSDDSVSYYGYSFTSISAHGVVHTGSVGTDVEPTCTEPGLSGAIICEICGKSANGQVLPALGHDYHVVVTPATPDSLGYSTYTCSRCGYSYEGDYIQFGVIDHGQSSDGLHWSIDDQGCLKISGEGPMGDYDDEGAPWEKYTDHIRTLVIEEGVTSISDFAFMKYTNLTEVVLPESLINIGAYAFYSCYGLKSLVLPSSLVDIWDEAFSNCLRLNTIVFRGDAPSIWDEAFYNVCAAVYYPAGNESWTEDVMEDYGGVLSWMDYSSESEIVIPDVEILGSGKCGENVTWVLDSERILTISGQGAMEDFEYDEAPWDSYSGTILEIIIEPGVTAIGTYAFSGCYHVTEVDIPIGVTAINARAFSSCEGLTRVTIPDSVTFIGNYAFSYCASLPEIMLPAGLSSIGDYTFASCFRLSEVEIPSSVTSIGQWAFSYCNDLSSLTIPTGVTSIGEYAFYSCKNLSSIFISDSVSSLGDNVFALCESLTEIHVDANNPSYSNDAYGVLFDKTKTVLVQVPAAYTGHYQIPATVTAIGDYAFFKCKSMTDVTVPDGVVSIGDMAFSYCTGLTGIDLPASLTELGDSAFYSCENLTSIRIPDKVTAIYDDTFWNCSDLTSVIIGSSVTSIGYQAFYDCSKLTNVTIPDCVTSIESSAFEGCGKLASITFGRNVASIANWAFCCCYDLTEIYFRGNAPAIGNYVFSETDPLTAYYPSGDPTWTSDVMQNYGGTITWVPYTVEEDPSYTVSYSSASISLAGDIGVNYYVQLSESIVADAGAYMQFTVAGQTQTVPLADAVVSAGSDGAVTYRFTCKVASKQMTEEITGQMYLSDGTAVGEAKSYSVKAYCDAAIPIYSQYPAYADLVDLMKAMLNYGAHSQTQFSYKTDDLANQGVETALPALTADDVAAFAHGASGSEAGISVASVSLLLESTTTIRFYFNLDGSKPIDAYTFYVDGVEAVPVESNGQYYVEKVNVAAKDLDEMVTVTVGGLTARYCGLSYVRQVAVLYPTYYSEALVNVAKALYAYNQAANAYFA